MANNWTLEKLNSYISEGVEENLHLDYKASDALSKSDGKKNEIAKDVSAFANSDGGTIIYGVAEFQTGLKHLPEKLDPIDRRTFSKETLEQIINSRISPRIHGVVISPVPVDTSNADLVVYVIEIPKGATAHQASDKRYYRRFNFESVPMDDWEIKDIVNRHTRSAIEIKLKPEFDLNILEACMELTGVLIKFDLIATNIGNKVIKYLNHYCPTKIFKGRPF
jgi:predicted HTH transcriptional regulator